MKLSLLGLLLAFVCLPTYAVDMTQPAQVQVTVKDTAGHPLPHAVVALGDAPNAVILPLSPGGQCLAERRIPPDLAASHIVWSEMLRVRLTGYLPDQEYLYSLFPGARVERQVTLQQSSATTLHLRGPKGEALAGVAPMIGYKDGSSFTTLINRDQRSDDMGRLLFAHPPLPSGFHLDIGAFHQDYPDRPEIAVTVPADEMPPIITHTVELTLIGPDGKPAAGWTVAPDATLQGEVCPVGGMVLTDQCVKYFHLGKMILTDPSGEARFSQTEAQFFVLSPQGVPFPYSVRPETWIPGPRRITLRLPPLRRTQTGQAIYPDGSPAAGIPVLPDQGRVNGENWALAQKDGATSAITTDAAGRYTVPVYFGIGPQYVIRTPKYITGATLATQSRVVLDQIGFETKQKPADYKHITLRFVDEQGKPLLDITAICTVFAGENETLSAQAIQDARASHLFVPVESDRLDLETSLKDTDPLRQSLRLSGTADQTFTITLPQSLHFHPLQGILLAPDARPVPNVKMNIFTIAPETSWQHRYLGYTITTDARGRFAFLTAPDSCEIDMYRSGPDDQPNLPGWTDPPIVTPQTRDILIRLKPVGSVLTRLPPEITALPSRVYLIGKTAVSPVFDRATHTLRFSSVQPGDYALTVGTDYDTADKTLQSLTVQPARETVVDLRDRAADIPPPPTPVPITVSVTENGQPVSGAIVTLGTDGPLWQPPAPTDLTDDAGIVRLPLEKGRSGLAIARVAGRLIGQAAFIAGAGVRVTVEMGSARSLSVTLNALPLVSGKPPDDDRQVVISRVGTPQPAFRARSDGENTWIAEDLPVGAYQIKVTTYRGETLAAQGVTLTAADPAVTNIRLETAPEPAR